MTAQQLDLFGAASVEVTSSGPQTFGPVRPVAVPSDTEATDSRHTRCEPEQHSDGDEQHLEREDDSTSGPSANVEPYRFTLADPGGRWAITAAHEDGTARGRTKRSLVARCSCGWVQPFSARSYGTASPDRLLAHVRTHQLTATPPAFAVEEDRDGWRCVRLIGGRMHCASAECHRLAPNDHRVQGGFAEPCPEHGGSLHERSYHWEEHDPEDHSGEPRMSHKSFLRDPDGLVWHYWCAPLEGRRRFGFVHADEAAAEEDDPDVEQPARAAPIEESPVRVAAVPDESPTELWCAGKEAGGLDHHGNRIPAAVQCIDTRAPLCLSCARCPQCLAEGDELCTCIAPCPEQDRGRLIVDWANEAYDGGRWGLVTKMDGPVICAARNTSCQAGRRIWSTLNAPSKDHRELVWQYPDGCIVHYRCAPDEARHRFDVEYEGVEIGKDPHPADNSKPRRATLHGIDGEWMFTGLGSRGNTRRYSAILWRRLGATLALETPPPEANELT